MRYSIQSLLTGAALLSAAHGRTPQTYDETNLAPSTLYAIEASNGEHDLWTVPEASALAATRISLPGVRLLDLDLVGYAVKDRLRADLPTSREAPIDHVLLPEGGALLRIERAGATELLHVTGDGAPVPVLSIPGLGTLDARAHVSADGRWAAVATAGTASGELWVVDLAGEFLPWCPTAKLPPLDIETRSIRVSVHAVWFTGDDAQYRAPSGGDATTVDLGLAQSEELLREPVLAEGGRHLAVLTEEVDDQRRLFVVPDVGPAMTVTTTPIAIFRTGLDDELGPYIAIAPDGSRVAWIVEETDSEELWARALDQSTNEHLTVEPVFPAYVDNIGVLAFGGPTTLCVFTGDTQISGIDDEEMIGAGEMYAACWEPHGVTEWMNVTRTNGQSEPPFTAPGLMVIEEAIVDPQVKRILIVGETKDETVELSCLRIDGLSNEGEPNLQLLATMLDDEPDLHRAGEHVLVITDDEATVQTGVHVLQPFDAASPFDLDAVLTLPGEELSIDRVTWGGGRAAIVEPSTGADLPWVVELEAAAAWRALPDGWEGLVSTTLALSFRGELRFGADPGSGLRHLAVPAPGTVVSLRLPVGQGFPIPVR